MMTMKQNANVLSKKSHIPSQNTINVTGMCKLRVILNWWNQITPVLNIEEVFAIDCSEFGVTWKRSKQTLPLKFLLTYKEIYSQLCQYCKICHFHFIYSLHNYSMFFFTKNSTLNIVDLSFRIAKSNILRDAHVDGKWYNMTDWLILIVWLLQRW